MSFGEGQALPDWIEGFGTHDHAIPCADCETWIQPGLSVFETKDSERLCFACVEAREPKSPDPTKLRPETLGQLPPVTRAGFCVVIPWCVQCGKPVDKLETSVDYLTGITRYGISCHGETDRFELHSGEDQRPRITDPRGRR